MPNIMFELPFCQYGHSLMALQITILPRKFVQNNRKRFGTDLFSVQLFYYVDNLKTV